MKKWIFRVWMLIAVWLVLAASAMAAEGEVVVFYTNDVHTYIDNGVSDETGLTYSRVAALRASEPGALLVDVGDHVQGTAYGSMDRGATMLRLMNAAGYDAATLGNHEFDYGMDGCLAAVDAADFPYTSCNFYHEQGGVAGETVLAPYVMLRAAGKQVAFVGITTPETFTSSTPAYFQDADGNYIYGIAGGADGAALYASVQTAIDSARAAGADYVIALGHLGVDASSGPWTSRAVIAHTTGLDAFIDGHSHTTIAMEQVADRSGRLVVLTQTGSYLDAVGKLTIRADGSVTSCLLTGEDLTDLTPDAQVKQIEDAWIAEIDSRLGAVIGYAEVTLDNYDSTGARLVRRQSTNTGDFAADALYALFDGMGMTVDVAIVNGGGIRNAAVTGEITYRTCKEIHTFGNVACLQTVTGQQLLDALEWGAKDLSADEAVENGGFLQVSGLQYRIDLSIPSTVQADSKGVWTGGPTGAYRVTDVQIWDRKTGTYQPLDRRATYNLAGYNYTLRDLGDGFAMFDGAVNVLDYVAEDYMVLASYIQSFPVDPETGLPTIAADSGYADVGGSGRITIVRSAAAPQENAQTQRGTTYTVVRGDSLWRIAEKLYGDGTRWRALYDENRDTIADPDLILPGQVLRLAA